MTKTANITLDFGLVLCIGKLTPRDAAIVRESLDDEFTNYDKFYYLLPEQQCDMMLPDEFKELECSIKYNILWKARNLLPRHFIRNGGSNIVSVNISRCDCGDRVFMIPSREVLVVANITVLVEVTIDEHNEIDQDKLLKLLNKEFREGNFIKDFDEILKHMSLDNISIDYR